MDELLCTYNDPDKAYNIEFEKLKEIINSVPDDGSFKFGWHREILIQFVDVFEDTCIC